MKAQASKRKSDSNLFSPINHISSVLGISTKVGEKNEAFSSGRIKEKDRISYGRPSEEELLVRFKKTVLEENFKRISDFSKLYSDFEERFYELNRSVDIQAMNNTLTQEEVKYYFTELEDTGMDLINNMCDLASYAKNKEYLELQNNILKAAKKILKPRMIGHFTDFPKNPKNMEDVIRTLRSIQARYIEGAPYVASMENHKIDTIEGRTLAFLDYNTRMKEAAKDSILNGLNKTISRIEDSSKKPKKHKLIMGEIIGLNADYAIEVKAGSEDQLIKQAKPLIKEFKELEEELKVIPESMTNSNGVLEYSLAKEAFKASGLKLGSTDDYLKRLKSKYSRMIALINSLCEIAYAVDTNNILENKVWKFLDEELSLNIENKHIYNSLMGAVERVAGKFVVFCEEKDLTWTSETGLKKAAAKFNTDWNRKVYKRESNEANKILEEIVDKYLYSNPDKKIVAACADTNEFVDNRDFIYTKTMLDIESLVSSLDSDEDRILNFMKNDSILSFDLKSEMVRTFLGLLQIFIKNDLIEYKFDKTSFPDITEEMISFILNNFPVFINSWLLQTNNTVSYYYFAKKMGFKKIEKAVEDKIEYLFEYFQVSEEELKLDYFKKLEVIAKVIPDILIFASIKGYEYNSIEKAEKLNKKFLQSKKS